MGIIAYDTETTGLYLYRGCEMFAYSLCDCDTGKITVRRLDGKGPKGLQDSGAEKLNRLFSGSDEIVMHNSKFDLAFTEKLLGRRLAETTKFHDTAIMSHLLRNDRDSHRLKDLAWELAGIPKDDEAEVRAYAKNKADEDYSRIPPDIMTRYQELDAKRTAVLFLGMMPRLRKEHKLFDCYQWERDVIIPTMRMEQRGFMINRERTERLRDEMDADAKAALDEAEQEYGQRIDIGNDNVLRRILYEEKHLPILKVTKTAGKPTVEKEILDELFQMTHDPLLRLAVRYKSRRRGATILGSYLECADEQGIIHPSIHTLGARTGRESCSDPNLQNVEKEGRLQNPFPTPARKAFRPRPGYVNFHVDYAGIELRLLVHYSKDQELVDEIRKPDGDPHYIAATIFYPPFSEQERDEYPDFCESHPTIAAGINAFARKTGEWSQLRDPAKNTNFAVPYGAGWQKASATLGLPELIGKKRFEIYRERFPRLVNMTRDISSIVKERGGVETTFGRFLHVPREKAYIGTNFLIQGTAAEILKRAQVRVHDYLEKATGGECGMLLPIHDELIIEWPRKRLSEAPAMWKKIKELMTDFPQFDVPLDVAVDVTTLDWSKKQEYSI